MTREVDEANNDEEMLAVNHERYRYLAYLCFILSPVAFYYGGRLGFLFLGIGIFTLWRVRVALKNAQRHEEILQAASQLNFEYIGSSDSSFLSGAIAKVGVKRIVSDFMTGELFRLPTKCFTVTFWIEKMVEKVSGGKINVEKEVYPYSYSVFELSIPSTVPPISIVAVSTDKDVRSYFLLEEEVLLEGNFNTMFSTSVGKGKQMEIREFLTPDIMEYLMQTMPNCSFLFGDGKLYVCTKKFDLSKELIDTHSNITFLVSKWSPSFSRI